VLYIFQTLANSRLVGDHLVQGLQSWHSVRDRVR